MDLRATLIKMLKLSQWATDADIANAVLKLKPAVDSQISAHSAIALAGAATDFQRRAAERGVNYDLPTAVRMVREGTTW